MKSRSRQYRSTYVQERRGRIKKALVMLSGGSCTQCGYDSCAAALAFHHLLDEGKDFGLSQGGLWHSFATLAEEVSKTVLLCSNCHREIHYKEDFVLLSSPKQISEEDLRTAVRALEHRIERVEGVRHGTASGYNIKKCRCDLCKEYHRIRYARYRAKKKSKNMQVSSQG